MYCTQQTTHHIIDHFYYPGQRNYYKIGGNFFSFQENSNYFKIYWQIQILTLKQILKLKFGDTLKLMRRNFERNVWENIEAKLRRNFEAKISQIFLL